MTDKTFPVRILQMRYEAETVLSLDLASPEGDELPAFAAGAHIDVRISDDCTRSYSLLNDPAERSRYVIAVNKEPNSRGGSRAVHEKLRVGDIVSISAPRNHFPLDENATHSIFIAGGIGVTPLLCMVRRLNALGRSWELHYAARDRKSASFLEDANALAKAGHGRVHVHLKRELGGSALDVPAVIQTADANAHFYCCGPVRLLEEFETATRKIEPGRVHLEYFAAKLAPALDGGYEVVLARSNKTIQVTSGKTLLQAMLEAKVNVNYACSQGMCGSCLVRVIEGIPDHRDGYLTDEEKAQDQQMIACCSGSKSARLVLDM